MLNSVPAERFQEPPPQAAPSGGKRFSNPITLLIIAVRPEITCGKAGRFECQVIQHHPQALDLSRDGMACCSISRGVRPALTTRKAEGPRANRPASADGLFPAPAIFYSRFPSPKRDPRLKKGEDFQPTPIDGSPYLFLPWPNGRGSHEENSRWNEGQEPTASPSRSAAPPFQIAHHLLDHLTVDGLFPAGIAIQQRVVADDIDQARNSAGIFE